MFFYLASLVNIYLCELDSADWCSNDQNDIIIGGSRKRLIQRSGDNGKSASSTVGLFSRVHWADSKSIAGSRRIPCEWARWCSPKSTALGSWAPSLSSVASYLLSPTTASIATLWKWWEMRQPCLPQNERRVASLHQSKLDLEQSCWHPNLFCLSVKN